MKVLSISQPWATLVMLGAKRFETRSWHTEHRGPLAIHAGKTFPANLRLLCQQEPIRGLLRQAGIRDRMGLPLGVVLGQVELLGCTRVEELPPLTGLDIALGDFQPGRWAWEFRAPVLLPNPLPALGRLGVFELSLSSTAG